MLNSKSFLAVDFGAATLKLAEFEVNEAGGLTLKQYSFRSLGQEGAQETTREGAVRKALQELLGERPYGSKNVNACAPGFHTFSKFVKLPPVDTSKVTQIIQYEAQQNVPFPLEEVVWDYQILGATDTGELEVLLVAVKQDIVEGLSRVAETAGLRMQLVDVSPAALCNAFRYNYGDLEGCTILLDIGAKTSNLLFFEKGRVYSRGINIGANSITQDFAKEARLGFDEAEKIKIEEGFVSLGGAYEEPDSPHQAAISKIARQVMTRLHIQMNQTLQFYRGQQGGSAPQRMFLSGGAAIMPYTAQFFAEKLNLPEGIDYFNPLRNVTLDPGLNLEELQKVAHSMGEVVGLGLRNLAHCPVELNLMPKSSLKRQQLKQKQPYFLASVGCLLMILLAFGFFYAKRAKEKEKTLAELEETLSPLQQADQRLENVKREVQREAEKLDQFTTLMEDRFIWADIAAGLRDLLIKVEEKKEGETKTDVGVWVEKFIPILPCPGVMAAPAEGASEVQNQNLPPVLGKKAAAAAKAGTALRCEISSVRLLFRAVNLSKLGPAANNELQYAVLDAVKQQSSLFADTTELSGNIGGGGTNDMTFTFEMMARLKRPLRF